MLLRKVHESFLSLYISSYKVIHLERKIALGYFLYLISINKFRSLVSMGAVGASAPKVFESVVQAPIIFGDIWFGERLP